MKVTEVQQAYYDGYEKGYQVASDEAKERVKDAETNANIWMAENKKLKNLYEKLKGWHRKALHVQLKMAEDLEPFLNKIDDLEAENKKLQMDKTIEGMI